VLPTTAVLDEHRECRDMPALPPTELALLTSSGALSSMQRALVDFLVAELEQAV
jgi:hypothetical protein